MKENENSQQIAARSRLKRHNWFIALCITITILCIVLIPICFVLSIFSSKTMMGGDAEPNIKKNIEKELTQAIKNEGFTGEIHNLKARHFGFSRGGIDGSFDYIETHPDIEIKIPISFETNDSGEFGNSETADTTIQPLKSASMLQPEVREEKSSIKKFFVKNENQGKYTLKDIDNIFYTEYDNYKQYDQQKNDKEYFNHIIQENKSDSIKKQYAAGYYHIPFKELKSHNLYYYRILLYINSDQTEKFNKNDFNIFLLKKYNEEKLPDGEYIIDIYSENKYSDKSTGISYLDTIQVIVKNGIATQPSKTCFDF